MKTIKIRWPPTREQIEKDAQEERFNRIYFAIVWAIVLIALILLLTLTALNLDQPKLITPEPPATAATDEYITRTAYAEPAPTSAPEPTPPPRYELTPDERDIVERTVMAEGGNTEDLKGLMLVAQCILNASELDGIRPDEAVELYQYAPPAEEANDRVREAVARVFDQGEMATNEPILFFYAPKYCRSDWHESLVFVAEHGGHRYFKLQEVG